MTGIEALMRPHLDGMWGDHDRLVQRVARVVTTQVPSYAATPSSEVWIGMNRILERAALGNPFGAPTEEDRLAAHGTGAQGAGAGITPEDLLAAVLLGAREVERDVLDRAASQGVGPAVLLEASALARIWAEQVAVWAVEGLGAATRPRSERQVLEARLVEALALGVSEEEGELARMLGIDPVSTWHAVTLVEAPRDGAANGSAAIALRLANPGGLWSTSACRGGAVEQHALVPAAPRVSDEVVVGVAGPAAWNELPQALLEAGRAARAALAFGLSGAQDLTSLGLLVPLHEDPRLAARLVERWVAPLAGEARHDLVATVRSWLDHGGQVELVARDFGVHANTVRNRLARVGQVVGDQWRTPRGQAELWAALQITR